MEDDWVFYVKRRYITDCLEVVSSSATLGQCLINKGSAETFDDIDLKGGIPMTTNTGVRYFIHEYGSTIEEQTALVVKYGGCRNCWYWPHFSLRPSLNDTKIMNAVGFFNENEPHFEMEFAKRYATNYKTAYLEGIYSRHIGRLTSEMEVVKNAYDLNDEKQFSKPEFVERTELKMSTLVVNLERRPDRYEKFMERLRIVHPTLPCSRFNAVDGKRLVSTPQLQRLFDGNDYNMTIGAVGCALSHICLCIDLLASEFNACCVFEDDAEFPDDFQDKFNTIISNLSKTWDLVYLGHHLRKQFIDPNASKDYLRIEQWNYDMSKLFSMGGTFGYIISRTGAKKLLDFIEKVGMINCIDTMQQRACDVMEVLYVSPCIVNSECFSDNVKADTDIQNNPGSLSVSKEQRIADETALYVGKDVTIVPMGNVSMEELECLKKEPWYVIAGDVIVSGKGCDGGRLKDASGNFSVEKILSAINE
jgi:glycosyl transferase family 25